MRQYDDAELVELFSDDPELMDLARAAQARELEAPMGANFQAYLRARLMDEAVVRLHPRGLARLRMALGSRSTMAAAFAAGAGAVMIAVTVVAVTQHGSDRVNAPAAESVLAGDSHVDPATDAITIAFTQPMDQASVVKALHIVPATSVTTSWSGNTLTITPKHGLSASTAYVVRIDNSVARSVSGQAPQAPIVVAFGTQPRPTATPGPTPTPTPATPVLAPTVLGQTGSVADVLAGPNGSVLVTDVASIGASQSSSQASGSSTGASSTATSTEGAGTSTGPGASASSSTSSSSSTTAAPSGLVRFDSGSASVVGASASAAAVAPSGRYIAALVHDQSGNATVVVENIDGTNRRQLAHADAGSPIAWTSGPAVLFTSGGHLRAVDLQGGIRSAGGPNGLVVGSGQQLLLAPGGHWAYLGPSSTTPASSTATDTSVSATTATAAAQLVDLTSGATLALPAAGSIAAFAPDASALAWADTADTRTADVLTLASSLPATASPAKVALADPGRAITVLAVSAGGSRVAATVASSEVRVVDTSGHLVATDPENATRLAFITDNTVALVAGGHAETAPLPSSGGTGTASPPPTASAEAQGLLDRLVAAQTGSGSLSSLPAAASIDLAALTPRGVTQGYVIAVEAIPNSSQVTASIRLVAIPAKGSSDPVTSSDESVTLDRPDGSTLRITQLSATPLSPESSGPHVMRVAASRSGSTMSVTVTFDSDLDPATVAPAISLTGPGGLATGSQVTFDASARTATVTLPLTGLLGNAAQPLTLSIATTLHDVDGNALASSYTTSVAA